MEAGERVARLDEDTDVQLAGGDPSGEADATATFRGTLSPDWAIWGPMGGYVGSLALRAAGVASRRPRPASFTAQFHGAGAFDEVEIHTRVLRKTRVATSVEVDITQGGRNILRATVWGVDELDGLEHHTSRQPTVPHPDSLPTADERWAAAGRNEGPPYEFWNRIDDRAITWIDDWENTPPSNPVSESWNRFVPAETFDHAWTDACRLLVMNDLYSWPAASPAHRMSNTMESWYAPTIELTTRFVGNARSEPWLYVYAEAPVAANGVVVARGEVWVNCAEGQQGRLVALGGSTLLSRPLPQQPARAQSSD